MPGYFAVLTRPTRPAMLTEGLNEHELASYGRHAAYLQDLIARGIAVFVGRTESTGPDAWALGVYQVDAEADARRIVEHDPFVADGVVTAELFPFGIIHPAPPAR